jgi:hypothetical protein
MADYFMMQKDPVENLCEAIDECLEAWGDDPAYRDAAFKLKQVERELDVIIASPGHRSALRGGPPKPSGQEVGEYSTYG